MEEDKNKNDRTGFVEKKTVDMKIYSADTEVAKWFKYFCDKQGVKFNVGIALLKGIAEEGEFKIAISTMLNDLTSRVNDIESYIQHKDKEEPKPEMLKVERPKTFGKKKKE